MKNLSYAILFTLLNILGSARTYVVAPALAEAPPRHPLTEAQIFTLVPVFIPISACETTGSVTGQGRQFNADGSILWGYQEDPITHKTVMVKRDVGRMQDNTIAHADMIQKENLDVENNEWDNVWLAYELWQQSGTKPWNASKACWDSQ